MAVYLPEFNALFVHTPKTGGTYVTRVLDELLPLKVQHVGYKHSHKDLVGPLRFVKRPYTFAFVRHPLSWYASYWQMKMRRRVRPWHYWEPTTLWHPNWEIDPSAGSDDFGEFIANVTRKPKFLHDMYQHYTGRGTRDEIQFVGKQERLIDDLILVFDELEIPYDEEALRKFGRVNSARKKRQPDYSDELRKMVLEAEAETIAAYGYHDDPTIIDAPAP